MEVPECKSRVGAAHEVSVLVLMPGPLQLKAIHRAVADTPTSAASTDEQQDLESTSHLQGRADAAAAGGQLAKATEGPDVSNGEKRLVVSTPYGDMLVPRPRHDSTAGRHGSNGAGLEQQGMWSQGQAQPPADGKGRSIVSTDKDEGSG